MEVLSQRIEFNSIVPKFPPELVSDKIALAQLFAATSSDRLEIARVLDRPDWRRARNQVNAWALSLGFPAVYQKNGQPSLSAIEEIRREVGLSGSSLELGPLIEYAFAFRARLELERQLQVGKSNDKANQTKSKKRNATDKKLPPLSDDHYMILEAMIEEQVFLTSPRTGPEICMMAFGVECDTTRKLKPLKDHGFIESKPRVGTWITQVGIEFLASRTS
jgi:hypothetical protein